MYDTVAMENLGLVLSSYPYQHVVGMWQPQPFSVKIHSYFMYEHNIDEPDI